MLSAEASEGPPQDKQRFTLTFQNSEGLTSDQS